MHSLPAYIEGPGGKDEATGKAITLLLEVSDFQQFKTMMMFYRREKEEAESKHADEQLVGVRTDGHDVAMIDDVEGMMDMCATLATAADTSGWTNMLTLDWMKIDSKAVEPEKRKKKNDIYLRGVWTMNLTFSECCDMMFTVSDRRKLWDPNFGKVEFPMGGDERSDDLITSVKLDFGYLVNLVMFGSKGMTLHSRNFRRWDKPTIGGVTYAMVPWDLQKNCLDPNHKLLSIKTGTIAPHPTIRGKSIMTTLEINGMGGMPTWAMHFMMRAFAPQVMRSMESRYIANVRNKGLSHDIRPTWRATTTSDEEAKEGGKSKGKNNRK